MANCSVKISKEHFISDSIQKLIAEKRKSIIVKGPSWLNPGEEKSIPIASLASNVLCQRHNEVLSGLDSVALKFLSYIFSLEDQPEALMINGGEIERWMLKVLCGYLASGWTGVNSDTIPPRWLSILFGDNNIPNGSGMYLMRGVDLSTQRHQVGSWLIESDATGEANGLYFIFSGFQFLFFMGKPKKRLPTALFQLGWQLKYRPECLVVIVNSIQREVHFGPPPRGGYVVIKVDKLPYSAEA